MVRCLVHLHGAEAEAGPVTTRVAVDALTINAVRAAYPFAGKFHFRLRRRLEDGTDVWWDLVGDPDRAHDVDDPGRVELRALCLDPDDPRWDGPVAARKEGLEAAREMVGNAARTVCEVRDKVQASEAAQAVAAKAREARAALGTNARKLGKWLDGL